MENQNTSNMLSIHQRFTDLETKVNVVDKEVDDVETRLGNKIKEVKDDLTGNMRDIKTDLKEDIKEVKTELKETKTELKDDIKGKQSNLKSFIGIIIAIAALFVPIFTEIVKVIMKSLFP